MELTKSGYRHILARSVAFECLSTAALDHIIARGLLIEMAPGEMVLAEGTRGPGLYVVLEGLVEIFLPDGATGGARRPTEVHLNTMGPGRCLGEYSLIDEHSTSAAARAMAGAKLFFLSREEFRRIAEGDPRVGKVIYLNLLRFLITRLRAKDEELDLFMMGSL
ncbi:MAG: cyclic nucleotide-binding domain-containing protein [Candidatus Rokuibacteriota bacterium]